VGAAAAAGCKAGGPAAAEGAGAERRERRQEVDPVIEVARLEGMPWPTEDPFLFCVHHDDRYPAGNEQLGPAASLAGRRIGHDFEGKDGWRMYHGDVVPGFPQHPHRGFETVTVVRHGLLDHSDSLGAAARYGEGDTQWLTAGGGIQHAEMFPLVNRTEPNPCEFFQIWLNLPRARKMVDPYFSMLWSPQIPRRTEKDTAGRATRLTLIAGSHGDAAPPAPPPDSYAADPSADVAIWTIDMDPGARWTLPAAQAGTHRTLYFFRGTNLRVSDRDVPSTHRVRLRGPHDAPLEAGPDGAQVLLLQGRPIGEPVVKHGPFVMNTRDEIQQAFTDYRRTGFGGWPWDRRDPVHGPTKGRFARHANGRTERPT
jgi:quercetin 2,3-dioxygenase